MATKDWFTSWFDTSYYHTLYKHRNDEEAQHFMQQIINFLKLPKSTHILDLPCGKGRHSIYLNSLGYKVTGCDLSPNSISLAKKFENETLNFKVADMREELNETYDAIFNLFTSFGYFEDDSEDLKILSTIKSGLKNDGIMVLDFLNVIKTKKNLVAKETKEIDGITFNIERRIHNGFIQKQISFFADGQQHEYTENVKFIDIEKMTTYFETVGLEVLHVFGDFNLNAFNEETSDRLIFVAK